MAVEARGGKRPYVYFIQAIAVQNSPDVVRNIHGQGHSFDVADSEDEAYGRGNHFVMCVPIDNIDWIGRHDMTAIKPAARPW